MRYRLNARGVAQRLAVGALSVAALGCTDDGASPAAAAPKTTALTAQGTLSVSVDGKAQVLDYQGLPAEVAAIHRIAKSATDYSCITQLDVALERPDHSCRLELKFLPTPSGLRVSGGQFYAVKTQVSGGAVIGTIPCGAWPGVSSKELIYKVLPGDGGISLGPLAPGKGMGTSATLTGQNLALSGQVFFQRLGTKIAVPLGTLSLKGTLVTTGSPTASCGSTVLATGKDLCSTEGAAGGSPGSLIRRDAQLYDCRTDTQVDLGELCGNDAIWVIDWRDWGTSKFLTQVAQVLGDIQDIQVGAAVVVVEGKDHLVVPTKDDPSKFEATGPRPSAAECLAIAQRDGIPDSVMLLVDKDAQLVMTGNTLTDLKLVPSCLVANAGGTIVATLPKGTSEPTNEEIKAAIEQAATMP